MRICPTLNNNIITNNYKTELSMTEDAPNATDHDDDGKRIASSNSYDLPNQEDDDNDVTMTEDAPYATDHDDKDDDNNVSFVPPFLLNVINELGRSILTRSINGCEDNLPDHDNDDSFLPPGILTLFERIENILDEWTIVMNEEFMNEDAMKPIRDRERKRRVGYEKHYYLITTLKQQPSERIENILDEWTIVMKEESMNKDAIKPIRNREGRKRAGYEKLYHLKATLKQQSSEAKASSNEVSLSTQSNNIQSVSCNLLSDRTPKSIKSKVKSTNARDRLSDRTPKATKPKVKSTNNVVRDLNFDRDNPPSSDLPSNVLKPSSELKLSSYKVLSDWTPNNIKSPLSSSNDIKVQRLSLSSSKETKLHQQASNDTK
jgi:hypothetical protein